MKTRKTEAVTASFHYFSRQTTDGDVVTESPFTGIEFDALAARLTSLKPLDLQSEEVKNLLRYKNMVPIEAVQIVTPKMLFGLYRGAYWGHAYENSEKGTISADSISLRPFYFLLYLSDSGKIYVGTQYLGPFGSYIGLRNTIISFLPERKNIVPHTFRLDAAILQNLVPKEVRVQISRKPTNIENGNLFDNEAVIVFKKKSKGDHFEEKVTKSILPFMGTTKQKVQEAVGTMLKHGKLVDVNDDDIVDCIIIGQVNGFRKTVYMMDQGSFASKFPLNVKVNQDGHPEYEETRLAISELLKTHIIARKEGA